MAATLTLKSVDGIRTDDGIGSSEWKLDINVLASQDPAVGFKTIHFDTGGVDSGDSFTGSGLHEAVGGPRKKKSPSLAPERGRIPRI
jgi:hypothetical protein